MSKKLKGGAAAKWHGLINKLKVDAAARGISTQDLAEMAGLSRGIITHWYTHNQKPRAGNWEKIQKTLAGLPVIHRQMVLVDDGQPVATVDPPQPVVVSDPVQINAAFDDEPVRRERIETEAERLAREGPTVLKVAGAAAKERMGQPTDAKTVLINLIAERLRPLPIAQVAAYLAHVLEQSS